MADNTTLNAGSGGDVIASDDIGGVKYQRVKVVIGADGTSDGDVASGNPMPVTGTVTANLGATDNAVLDDIAAQALAIKTAVETLDNAIAGAEMQVDIVASAAIPVTDNSGSLTVDAPVGTPVFVRLSDGSSVISTLPVSLASVPSHAVTNAGTFAVQAAQSGTWTVQPGNTANTTPWLVTPTPATSGGLSTFRSLDLDETEEDVKTSAGQVFGYYIANLAGSVRFVKFYNATAANVTVGSTTPVWTLPIPAGAAANVEFSHGVSFSTAISVAATTGVADNDAGAPGANEIICNVFYK